MFSPIEVRSIIDVSETLYITIPKSWYLGWKSPQQLSVEYMEPQSSDKIMLVRNCVDSNSVPLKSISGSRLLPIRKDFVNKDELPHLVGLHNHGNYCEIIIPAKKLTRNEITYKVKMREQKLSRYI
jgi:hypothetical protein